MMYLLLVNFLVRQLKPLVFDNTHTQIDQKQQQSLQKTIKT